jgi:hypothetical protein
MTRLCVPVRSSSTEANWPVAAWCWISLIILVRLWGVHLAARGSGLG